MSVAVACRMGWKRWREGGWIASRSSSTLCSQCRLWECDVMSAGRGQGDSVGVLPSGARAVKQAHGSRSGSVRASMRREKSTASQLKPEEKKKARFEGAHSPAWLSPANCGLLDPLRRVALRLRVHPSCPSRSHAPCSPPSIRAESRPANSIPLNYNAMLAISLPSPLPAKAR